MADTCTMHVSNGDDTNIPNPQIYSPEPGTSVTERDGGRVTAAMSSAPTELKSILRKSLLRISCEYCDAVFTNVGECTLHKQQHRLRTVATEPLLFMCKVCDLAFKTAADLVLHPCTRSTAIE